MNAGRRAFLISAVLVTALPGLGIGQVSDPNGLLARPARLSVTDTLLQDALRALHQHSGVSIAFSPDLLPEGLRVTCPCQDSTVGEALHQILKDTELTFEATRTLIRIVPPPPPTQIR